MFFCTYYSSPSLERKIEFHVVVDTSTSRVKTFACKPNCACHWSFFYPPLLFLTEILAINSGNTSRAVIRTVLFRTPHFLMCGDKLTTTESLLNVCLKTHFEAAYYLWFCMSDVTVTLTLVIQVGCVFLQVLGCFIISQRKLSYLVERKHEL